MRAACLLLFLWWCSVSSAAVSPLCLTHAALSVAEARRGATWALHMLDASTKVPDGLLYGNTMQLGHFDQCLAVDVHPESLPAFQGRYCRASLSIEPDSSLPSMIYALCVPSSCQPEDVESLLEENVASMLGLDINVTSLDPQDCYVKGPSAALSSGAIGFIVLLALLTSLVLICTCLEAWRGPESPPLLRAFSARTTVRQLFSTRREPGALSCLHGLRVGSILWVLLGHRYSQETRGTVSNAATIDEYFEHPLKMTVGNGMVSVDTFFLLSGLLMCLSFMREMQRGATFDVLKFYLYRYLRLVAPMALVIFFYATLFPFLGNGPLWNSIILTEANRCQEKWWTNILYINNYYLQGRAMCLGQTWYTAVDMQLAWLSPLVLLPLKFSPRAGLQLSAILLVLSCAIPFANTYVYKFPMTSLQIPVDIDRGDAPEGNFSFLIYNATQSRATPYLCGILVGYLIFKMNKKKLDIPQAAVVLGWTLSTLVCLTVVFSLTISYQPDYVYDDLAASFYAGLHRLAWSAGLSWIIVACVNGYGGWVDQILSWRLLLPLSRLTYSTYLVHMIVLQYDQANFHTPHYFSDYSSIHAFFGDLVPELLLAFLLYLLVEGPLLAVLKIVFKGGKRKNKISNIVEQKGPN